MAVLGVSFLAAHYGSTPPKRSALNKTTTHSCILEETCRGNHVYVWVFRLEFVLRGVKSASFSNWWLGWVVWRSGGVSHLPTRTRGSNPKPPTGYGPKSNHQELDRQFWSMFPLTRATHVGVTLFLTTRMKFASAPLKSMTSCCLTCLRLGSGPAQPLARPVSPAHPASGPSLSETGPSKPSPAPSPRPRRISRPAPRSGLSNVSETGLKLCQPPSPSDVPQPLSPAAQATLDLLLASGPKSSGPAPSRD